MATAKTTLKVTPKVIEDVIKKTAGADCIPVYKALRGKKNVSEFVLAEQIEEEINTTRNMLYRLYNANLVQFMRKKDKQKGWYIYYWTFEPGVVKHKLKNLTKKRLENLTERLEREQNNHFYVCERGCIRLDFEKATDYEYKCPECGSLLQLQDNSQLIKDLEKEKKELEKDLKRIK